jgi:hypothetical protein
MQTRVHMLATAGIDAVRAAPVLRLQHLSLRREVRGCNVFWDRHLTDVLLVNTVKPF